jgi:polysaccharide export outer membrane protein
MLPVRAFLGLFLALLVAGCSTSEVVDSQSGSLALASYRGAPPPRGGLGAYVIGPGDRLRLKAYSDDQLSGEYEVNSGGFVSIPLVGDVRAAGRTTYQLEQTIIARMKGKIAQDPKINIEIADYAPFYIYGEVKKAGAYPYRPGLTVADAIATAGGLTYRANENRIYLQHNGYGKEQMVPLEVPTRIYPGDNIRVSERIF